MAHFVAKHVANNIHMNSPETISTNSLAQSATHNKLNTSNFASLPISNTIEFLTNVKFNV